MGKTIISLGEMNIIPADWSSVDAAETTALREGLHEILVGLGCRCNGEAIANDSVRATAQARIKALAVSRRIDVGMTELAQSRGVDVATASRAEITSASSADEINSLIALEQLISQETIESVVTNQEMGVIEQEEMAGHRSIRDPHWSRDLTGIIAHASPHPVEYRDPDSGLWIVKMSQVQLNKIRVEVDNHGEVCAWLYEENEL